MTVAMKITAIVRVAVSCEPKVLSSELIDRKEDREEDRVVDMRKPQVRHTPHRKAMREMKQSVPRIRNVMMYTFASPTKSSGLKQVKANMKAAGMPTVSILGI